MWTGYNKVVTTDHVTHLFANAGEANTEGPNNALPIATEPLRYFTSEPGVAEYIRLPMPGTDVHTPVIHSHKPPLADTHFTSLHSNTVFYISVHSC